MMERPDWQSSHERLGGSHHQLGSPVTTSLETMIDEFPNPQSPDCCIYRAPIKFRQGNEKFFIPQLVSVGPLHHGLPALQYMEEHKPAYLQAFLNRSHLSLRDIVMVIKDWESRIRNCYTEQIWLNSDDLVKMIVLDSCFVIEVIYRSYEVIRQRDDQTTDYLSLQRDHRTDYLSRSIMISDVRTDLILLENQLPFFVLEGLYDRAFPNNGVNFRAICLSYFEIVMFAGYSEKLLRAKYQSVPEIKHILDLLRTYHAPSAPRPPRGDIERRVTRMRRATELQDAGVVMIKQREDEDRSVSDISYTKGQLEMPKVIMNSAAVEHLFRNLLAFERCHYQHSTDVTDYLLFLDDLIHTGKDVDLLIANGILENFLSDSYAVARLVKGLHVRIHSRRYYYSNYYANIRDQINEYCEEPCPSWRATWNCWRATLIRDYFGTPWLVASTIAAAALLLLTLIQTYYSVISFRDNQDQ